MVKIRLNHTKSFLDFWLKIFKFPPVLFMVAKVSELSTSSLVHLVFLHFFLSLPKVPMFLLIFTELLVYLLLLSSLLLFFSPFIFPLLLFFLSYLFLFEALPGFSPRSIVAPLLEGSSLFFTPGSASAYALRTTLFYFFNHQTFLLTMCRPSISYNFT